MPRVVSLTPAVFHLPELVNEVSRTYGASPIVPRGPRAKPLFDGVRRGIQEALGAPNHQAIMMTGSGSTAMASVLGSCLKPDERLLIVRNGAYGDRLFEFATAMRQPIVDLAFPYGERPDLARIEALLAADQVDAVAMVYGATSSCTLNPVAEVGALTKKYGKKFLLDGVSAVFVELVDVDAWNVSALMGSCNKGLHAHPNMTFALVREDLLREMEHYPQRAPSLELYKIWRAQLNASHPYTIDMMSFAQVGAALQHLKNEGGVPGRHEIYSKRCKILRDGYAKLGLSVGTWEGSPLQSIGTCVGYPKGQTYESLAHRLSTEVCEDHLFEIYTSQGRLSDKLFRVFNLGEYPLEVYDIFIKSLARVC